MLRRLHNVLGWIGLAVAGVLALAVLALGWRIVFSGQRDDAEHVRLKHDYLSRVAALPAPAARRPNVVLVLLDDLGYGDLGSYGSRSIRTPHLDRLAAEGMRFRQAYAASAYCSASRAALLTGRWPFRAGLDHVLQDPWSSRDLLLRIGARNRRLPAEEILLSEVLSAAGYATAAVGKWHLGDVSPSLPNDRGFDTYWGMLFSNDQGDPVLWADRAVAEPHPVDQATLTGRYTERAVAFIEQNRDRPFFLYLAHTFPHEPLYAGYAEVVEALDASIGAVLEALAQHGLDRETLVVVTSDNGPWFEGSTAGLRGRKLEIFEGGLRVPLLARWPGRFPGGRISDAMASGIDVFPTVLDLAGLPLPEDRVIDGVSLAALLEGGSEEPRDTLYYHQLGHVQAVREGRFKYHAPHRLLYGNPMDWPWAPMARRGPWLFDLEQDPAESWNVASRHPEVAARLERKLEGWRAQQRANLQGWR